MDDLSNPLKNEKKTALIVEDSQPQALALTSLLENQGLNVLSTPNGVDGFVLARKHEPDVVILDINLPDISGMQICYILKQDPRTSHIPVVMLTSQPREEWREESKETAGALEFIPKDAFTEIVLLELLRKLKIIPEISS